MGGIVAWKQAKAIVVLGGQNRTAHACVAQRTHPLIRIQLRRAKKGWACLAVTPFLIPKKVFIPKWRNA